MYVYEMKGSYMGQDFEDRFEIDFTTQDKAECWAVEECKRLMSYKDHVFKWCDVSWYDGKDRTTTKSIMQLFIKDGELHKEFAGDPNGDIYKADEVKRW